MTPVGELIVRWTVRVVVGCVLLAVLPGVRPGTRRRLWTLGWACYVAHVVAAFHFAHGWSHAAAWEETRRQTRELTGWDGGAGLWVNYAFTIGWTADVLRRWLVPDWSPGGRVGTWVWRGLFAFVLVNATVVFSPPGWRWVGVAFAVLWGLSYFGRGASERVQN